MRKIIITVVFLNGMIEKREVDSVSGYDYHSDFIVVHEERDGVTYDYPYCLRDINYMTREPVETIH